MNKMSDFPRRQDDLKAAQRSKSESRISRGATIVWILLCLGTTGLFETRVHATEGDGSKAELSASQNKRLAPKQDSQPVLEPRAVNFIAHFLEIHDSGDPDWRKAKEFRKFGELAESTSDIEYRPAGQPVGWLAKSHPIEIQEFFLTNSWSKMTAEEFRSFVLFLQQRDGIDYLSLPPVSTKAGLSVHQSTQYTNTVTKIPDGKGDYRYVNNLSILHSNVFFGGTPSWPHEISIKDSIEMFNEPPGIDIMPTEENGEWRLDISAYFDEFLGYKNPKTQAFLAKDREKISRFKSAKAVFRSRSTSAVTSCRINEVVGVRFSTLEDRIQIEGGFFQSPETRIDRKSLYVFIEVLDQAGLKQKLNL